MASIAVNTETTSEIMRRERKVNVEYVGNFGRKKSSNNVRS